MKFFGDEMLQMETSNVNSSEFLKSMVSLHEFYT